MEAELMAGQQSEIADAAGRQSPAIGQQAESADAPPAADAAMADAASAGSELLPRIQSR